MRSYVEEHMRESLAKHILEPHADCERLKAFYLKRPGSGRMMSCLIVFTIEGIVIQGDLTPCQNGVVSCYGYSIEWFAGRKSEDYLCEKFLSKEFVTELAEQSFKRQLLERRREARNWPISSPSKATAREAWDWFDTCRDEMDSRSFYDHYYETFHDAPECGYGYNPADAGWLCAIQQRFAALYAERAA